ncbi:hypothetical protein GCM10023142_14470 [Anaerocolumna aminovalerica]|uniref:ABC-2 family transporter protein n=2 Tax=Bacillota TaxID=1239 RepID=A0A1I5F7N2_9FIRM|nr:hypothetical protein [Anaerocolumna aminovalerica]MBU5334036.1 hypothetical protein [Anaerocolumna aminovalerica]MDU6266237.1 hypothetical protein [Anaerocolumna aminovalerica]SFO19646.1 hypothetical protein SAMN04489757_11287 [Anaerocolumna aminovalerica]
METKYYTLNYILGSIKQVINIRIIFIILGIFLCICLDTWNQIPFLWAAKDSTIDVRYYWFNSYSYGGVYSSCFMPMLASAVYATSYCKEHLSKMDSLIIGRIGCIKYGISKIIVNSLSSGIAVFLGGGLFVFIASFFKPLYNTNSDMEAMGFPYFDYLNKGNGFLYFIIVLYLAFLVGILWSTIALTVSVFITNSYIVIATPFLLSFFLSRVYVLFQTPYNLRLDYLLSGLSIYRSDKMTLLFCTFAILIIVIICSIIFYKKVERSYKNG